jgi:hypothetical protein
MLLALILVACETAEEADKANFDEHIRKWQTQRGLIHAGSKGRMKSLRKT